jgi:hypothetical protein
MKLCLLRFTCCLALGQLAVPAYAASILVTPRLTSTTADSSFCSVVNAGPTSIVVAIEMLSFDGTAIAGPVDITVAPDHSTSITAGASTFHCRFTGAFVKTHVRAAASISSGGHTIVAVPAQ